MMYVKSIDEDAGTLGGSGAERVPTKVDCRLVEMAIRERWPIPDSARDAMIEQLAKVVEEDGIMNRKPRLFLACAKTLTSLSRLNLSVVDTALRAKAGEELEKRIAELEARLKEKP